MIKSLSGGGLVRLLQSLEVTPEKAIVIDAAGGVVLEDRLINKPFSMGITAGTPGDLSVNITTQTCRYDKIGDFVDVSIVLAFTLTYTTAVGNLILTGLPFAADADTAANLIQMGMSSAFVWPNTGSQIALTPQASATTALILGQKSGATAQALPVTALASGAAHTLRFRGRYRTART